MSAKKYLIEFDPLAIGLTRPAVYMGIDVRFFFANVVFGVLVCLYSKTLYGIVLSLINYVVLRKLSQKDIQFFALYWTVFKKTLPLLTYGFWGNTNSYQPW